jgi:branched-chain amino acid aminotransferase
VNGRLCDVADATIPATDQGLLRGDGCFEYVRVYLGKPFLLFEHLERLERSCGVLHLSNPRKELDADIAAVADAMAAGNPRGLSYDLRIVLTRGGSRLVLSEPLVTSLGPAALGLVTDAARPLLIGAKTLSYAANMLAQRLAQERGFDEALLVTPTGHILEVQTSAFFWVADDGAVCTPPLSEGILDSITRRLLMQHLRVEERVCDVDDALAAGEAFISGTGWEVRPVSQIEDREFGAVPGVATREALKVMWQEVETHTGLDLGPHFAQAGSPDFVLAAWREVHASRR